MPSILTTRRAFLAASFASALPIRTVAAAIDRSRVSAITDEIARSPADAIVFAHTFGLEWLSLRDVPAPLHSHPPSYYALDPAAMTEAAKQFKDAGIRIGFLDTPFLKFGLPGTDPVRKAQDPQKRMARDKALFDARLTDLRQGIVASQVFECPMLRIFTFSRVAEPESVFPRVAEIITDMAAIAQKEGVKLLIENEASQNVGTSAEAARLVKMLPSNVGLNWDSLNGLALGEKPFPDGYNSLPKDRVWNVHVKGKSLLDYPEHLDWPSIIRALEHDGYRGRLELETHIFGEQQVAASHASMKELLRLLNANQGT